MRIKNIKIHNYKLNIVKTKKYKTISIRLVFHSPLKKENITKQNFLFDMLIHSCKKYPTKKEMNIKCQDLYSLTLNAASFRLGNYLASEIDMTFLNPLYTEPKMLYESLDFLYEVLFNPLVNDQKFDQLSFDIVKKDLQSEIVTVKENGHMYANTRILELMDENAPYNYHNFCYKEDLEQITPQSLYDFYKDFFVQNKVQVFVIGDVDAKKISKIFKEKFIFPSQASFSDSLFYQHKSVREIPQKIVESGNYTQANLVVSLKVDCENTFVRDYVSVVYNYLLGGMTDSFLMRNVREKESLAYFVYSLYRKADSLIMIYCGIDANNYEKTLSMINKSIKDIYDGMFTENDIEKGKMEYISSLKMLHDTQNGVLDLLVPNAFYNVDAYETKIKKIKEVTIEDVLDFTRHIKIDTIYMLKGE